MIIDVHAHALHEPFIAEMAGDPGFPMPFEKIEGGGYRIAGYGPMDPLVYDLEGRVKSLESRGVDLQLISPPPKVISNVDAAADAALARKINDSTARLIEEGGSRLAGLAVPPVGEPAKCAEEVRRAAGEHGFKGTVIGTTAAGRVMDDPAFDPMWAAFEELGLLVFMHPTSGPHRERIEEYTIRTLVYWPTETAICVSRLIFAGLFERRPGVNLVLSHGGGTLPFLRGRLNLVYNAPEYEANEDCRKNISKPPGDYFDQIFFDTCVGSPESTKFLVDLLGAERVMFGTDFPYEIGDPEGKHALPAIDALPGGDREKIMGGNAAAVLDKVRG